MEGLSAGRPSQDAMQIRVVPQNHHGIRAPFNTSTQTVCACGYVGLGEGVRRLGVWVGELPRHRRGPQKENILACAARRSTRTSRSEWASIWVYVCSTWSNRINPPFLGQRSRTRAWVRVESAQKRESEIGCPLPLWRGTSKKGTFPRSMRTDGGDRGRKPGETRVNLNTHCYSAWRGETKSLLVGSQYDLFRLPSDSRFCVGSAPRSYPTLAHTIRIWTSYLHSADIHRERSWILWSRRVPESARRETLTAYIDHSKPRKKLRDGSPGRLFYRVV